jgi:hypothetical protein
LDAMRFSGDFAGCNWLESIPSSAKYGQSEGLALTLEVSS